jgi:hypothetical protein
MAASSREIYSEAREIVGRILDREGITGFQRIPYHNFAFRLLRLLRRTPREDWDKIIEALIAWHKYSWGAKKTVMRKIVKALVKHYFSPSQPRPPA